MKIWILGSRGQLGYSLSKFYNNFNLEVLDSSGFDITNKDNLVKTAREFYPNIIFNCAAYTDVEGCENNQDLAYRVNSYALDNISKAAEVSNAKVIHFSTDYIFDGEKKGAYLESDIPNPLMVYGKSKLLGEKILSENYDKYIIIRTEWLYSVYGNNFYKKILENSKNREKINVVSDQIGCPTSTSELVKIIDLLIKFDKKGTYNATCSGQCSRFDFAKQIVELKNLDVKINAIKSSDYISKVSRPKNSLLCNEKLIKDTGYTPLPWKDALEMVVYGK